MIYGKTMKDLERVATTPAGGGDITPAPAVPATSLATRSTAGDAGVVEQRTADDSPLSAGSDENLFNWSLDAEDDTDQNAFPRSRRLICSASTDGQVTIARKGEAGLALTAEEAHVLYAFLGDAARIWGKAIA